MRLTAKAPALNSLSAIVLGIALVGLIAAPFMVYPIFLMKMLCFALFASAFNLLLGYTGILSFGHAAFFGGGLREQPMRSRNGASHRNWASCSVFWPQPPLASSSAISPFAVRASIQR